jgi:hypothetical protein
LKNAEFCLYRLRNRRVELKSVVETRGFVSFMLRIGGRICGFFVWIDNVFEDFLKIYLVWNI